MFEVSKKVFPVILIFLLSLFFGSVNSYATDDSSIEDQNLIRVGYYQNEVFEDGASEDEIKKGYAYEYYRKISEYTGWNYKYVYGDFVTIYQKLLDGEVDLVAGLANTEDRASLILFPDKAMGWESYGIVKHESDSRITTDRQTLNGRNIGVLDSAIVNVLNEFLEKENITASVIKYNDYETLLTAFDKRELDVIAAEIDGIYARNHAEVLYSFGDTEYFLGVNKNRADILQDLNLAQEQIYMENPDYLSLLRSKYYGSTLSSRAFTGSEIEWLNEHDTVTVGYLNDYLPYCAKDKNGNITGIISEILPKIFSELGYSSKTINYVGFDTYDEITKAIRQNQIDVAFPSGGGLFFSEEDGIYLSEPVITSVTDLVYSDNYTKSPSNYFVASSRNKLQYYYIKNNYPDANISFCDDIIDCLDSVVDGKATCTTVNGLRTSLLMKRKKYNDLSFIQLPASEDISFGVKIGNDGLLKILNRGLNVLDADYAQNMAVRYTQSMYSYTLQDFLRHFSYVFATITFVIILIIFFFLVLDIKRNRKLASEKEKTKNEIEKANHEKFVFMNKMANYMREPMNKLISLIDNTKNATDRANIDSNLDEMSSYSKDIVSIINNILNMSRFESGQLQLTDQNIVNNLQGKRILIIESSDQNAVITSSIMKKLGFEIQTASDGEQAYEKLNAAPSGYFDAVILSVENNTKDEYNSAINIRNLNNPDKAAIPIIAILSTEEQKESEDYQNAQINGAICKPFELDQMMKTFVTIFN